MPSWQNNCWSKLYLSIICRHILHDIGLNLHGNWCLFCHDLLRHHTHAHTSMHAHTCTGACTTAQHTLDNIPNLWLYEFLNFLRIKKLYTFSHSPSIYRSKRRKDSETRSSAKPDRSDNSYNSQTYSLMLKTSIDYLLSQIFFS